jgi:hypothetical protein
MDSTRLSGTLVSGVLALCLLSGSAAAQFASNTSDVPTIGSANSSNTENVDFGDVDLDGDWDAVFADGGDNTQDQNRIWINRGPGANLGKFQDETTTRFPAINDQSRDIEFVDFDNDSDLDLYTSNTAALVAQGNRWWRNTGTGSGNYVDETSTRWVGLASANSSIAASQLLGDGTFIDFSCDCDFGDLDNDGDMDLFHSSYGGVFGGQVPSRIFLNDGNGFFEEFNPSGFKLSGQTIQSGNPGIWCQGTQQSNTTNTNGNNCDVASSALDIDIGDIDGDFDLDVLHGARQEVPRMFRNLLEENGGTLGFRDVSAAVFPANYSTGNGHYEQEMGDLDGDGDLDIYGLNWQVNFGFDDITLRNNGAGVYSNLTVLSGSSSDDNEGDFLDYDNDGDLDLFVANFSGQDRLYRNNSDGGASFSYSQVSFPSSTGTALDADCCDVDGDGDYDIFVANDNNQANRYFENTTQTPDAHAPYLPSVEQAPDRTAGPTPTVVRAQVYDNAPYYITWYNPTTLTYTVNGSGGATLPARSSGGQIFRAEIPGTEVGLIEYSFTSRDEYGNSGLSATRSFVATGDVTTGIAYCFGDGSGSACPCANWGATGEGCLNSTGGGGNLSASGAASVSSDTLSLTAAGLPFGVSGIFFGGTTQLGAGNGVPYGDGLICAGGAVTRLQIVLTSGAGTASSSVGISLTDGATAGQTRSYQYWHRDPAPGACGGGFNLTNAVAIDWMN